MVVVEFISTPVGDKPRPYGGINPKHEMPNPKQYQITKIQMTQMVLNLEFRN